MQLVAEIQTVQWLYEVVVMATQHASTDRSRLAGPGGAMGFAGSTQDIILQWVVDL